MSLTRNTSTGLSPSAISRVKCKNNKHINQQTNPIFVPGIRGPPGPGLQNYYTWKVTLGPQDTQKTVLTLQIDPNTSVFLMNKFAVICTGPQSSPDINKGRGGSIDNTIVNRNTVNIFPNIYALNGDTFTSNDPAFSVVSSAPNTIDVVCIGSSGNVCNFSGTTNFTSTGKVKVIKKCMSLL